MYQSLLCIFVINIKAIKVPQVYFAFALKMCTTSPGHCLGPEPWTHRLIPYLWDKLLLHTNPQVSCLSSASPCFKMALDKKSKYHHSRTHERNFWVSGAWLCGVERTVAGETESARSGKAFDFHKWSANEGSWVEAEISPQRLQEAVTSPNVQIPIVIIYT